MEKALLLSRILRTSRLQDPDAGQLPRRRPDGSRAIGYYKAVTRAEPSGVRPLFGLAEVPEAPGRRSRRAIDARRKRHTRYPGGGRRQGARDGTH